MAMEDPILFTGKELNFEVPKMTELNSAEQRLRDKITKQEDLQTKYQDEIRKNLNIDTQALVSDFSRKQQYEAVKAFQDKWTKIAKERGNKLTSDDLMEMEKDRSGIANLQNEWKSSQTLWEQDQAMIKKSPADFDIAKFTADTDAFLSTGQYKPNSLEFSGINMDDFFSGERWSGSASTTEDVVAGSDGFDTYTQKSVNATPEEAKRHILQVVLSDTTGRALKGIMKDFMSEPETGGEFAKIKYLKDFDTDNSGTISSNEMAAANVKMSSRNILTNPILQYAQDKYLRSVLKEKVTTDKKRRANTPTDPTAYETQSWEDPATGVRHSKKVPATEAPVVEPSVGLKAVGGIYNIGRGMESTTFETPISVGGIDDVVSAKPIHFDSKSNKVKIAVTAKTGLRKKKRESKVIEISIDDISKMPDNELKAGIMETIIDTPNGDMTVKDYIGGGTEKTPINKPKLY